MDPQKTPIKKPDSALVDEFRSMPLGHHSPELQRLLTTFRGAPMEGKHMLVCTKAHEEWVLGRLPGGRGEAVELTGEVFHSLADAEWSVFKRRWEHHFGERLQD